MTIPSRDQYIPDSLNRGKGLCDPLSIPHLVHDIVPTLEAIGCHPWRDEAIRSIFPEYDEGWNNRIVIIQDQLKTERLSYFKIIIESPNCRNHAFRIPRNSAASSSFIRLYIP